MVGGAGTPVISQVRAVDASATQSHLGDDDAMSAQYPPSAMTHLCSGGTELKPFDAITQLQRTLMDDREGFRARYLAANLTCLNLMVIELEKLIQLGMELEQYMRDMLGNDPADQSVIENIRQCNDGLISMNSEIKRGIILLYGSVGSILSEEK